VTTGQRPGGHPGVATAEGPRTSGSLPRTEEWARRRQELAASFECPDPTGAEAPCRARVEIFGAYQFPDIATPYGILRCPAAERIGCAVFKRFRDAAEAQRRREWIDEGLHRGISRRFLQVAFASIDATPAVAQARRFVTTDALQGRAMFLLGTVGSGKTTAASAAVRAWPTGARFVSAVDLARDLLDRDTREDARELLEAPFLALDDYGQEYAPPGGFVASELEEAFTRRHAAMLPLLVTSNLGPRALKARLGHRVWDRLREWAELVEITGPSLRRLG
jgi:DNA replication protein DnaC